MTQQATSAKARAIDGTKQKHDSGARSWTEEDKAELKRLYLKERLLLAEIGARLGRSAKAIEKKIAALRLKRPRARTSSRPADLPPDVAPVAKLRRCKGPCGRMFLSEGVHNQICPPCKDYINGTARGGYDEMTLASVRRG